MSTTFSTAQHQAYVLHKRAYSETSLIVELFIRDVGKKTLIAKGARRKKSQFSGILEPFNQLRVNWSGRSSLATLTLAERCQEPVQLVSKRLFCGLYLNELIMNLLTHDDPHQHLFDHYQHCIHALQSSLDLELLLRQFELTLLEQIGYGLQLEHEGQNGEPVVAEKRYRYLSDQGLVTVERTDLTTITGSTLIALLRGEALTDQQKREAKLLLRGIIDNRLEGKPLRSRDLFRTIQTS